jgi:hypothetical protein
MLQANGNTNHMSYDSDNPVSHRRGNYHGRVTVIAIYAKIFENRENFDITSQVELINKLGEISKISLSYHETYIA